MTKETKYGFISDVHQDARIVEPMVKVFEKRKVDSIILNGDIGELGGNLQASVNYMANILAMACKKGMETFVLPGSHEPIILYDQVMDYFTTQFSNVVDAKNIPFVDKDGHRLLFIPGSDFSCGGEYVIGNYFPSGRYYNIEGTKVPVAHRKDDWKGHLKEMLNEKGGFFYSNINDLRKSVQDPDKTIVICHVPRKFDNLETCVDMAHFWQGRVYHRNINDMSKWTYTELSVIPGVVKKDYIERSQKTKAFSVGVSEEEILEETLKLIEKEDVNRWQVFVEKIQNRGNEDLKNLYEELGIKKAVSGHFHEASHRANDREGNHVEEGKEASELFWNSGCADFGHFGILTVRDNKVKYENLNI